MPAEALARVLNNPPADESARLAVPLAGDDRAAKALVERFMRGIGVEPFDLGASANGDLLERVADLATNIGQDAVYLAEGKQIKHHFEERAAAKTGTPRP